MKVVHIGYKGWGSSYIDHLEKTGQPVDRFYLSYPAKTSFMSKGQWVAVTIRSAIEMLLHLREFKGIKAFSAGGGNSCLLVYRLFGWALGKNRHLYLHCYFIHGLGKKRYIQRMLSFLMNNDKVTLIAQTPNEIEYYGKLSKKIHLEFVPYCSDVEPRDNNVSLQDGYIFTGGYTNRDYKLMTELAKRMPNKKFMFVASFLNKELSELPENVELKRDVTPDDFASLMEHSSMVIVPMKEDVGSSGQMLSIQAMRYHKPIVYTDVSSINYYFTENSGIPYNMGDIHSLYNAVCALFSDEKKARQMGENAYKESLKYTSAEGFRMLDKIILLQ